MADQSATSRIANCRRIEEFEGDLDFAYRQDRMRGLLERLEYSKQDAVRSRSPRHRIPIAGNVYNGTATLRAAARLYLDFCKGQTARIPVGRPSPKSSKAKPTEESERPFIGIPTRDLLTNFANILAELRERKILRTVNNPVADYAEYLVSRALNLHLLGNSTAGHDAVDRGGARFEIKARRNAANTNSHQLSAIRNLDAAKFDFLVAVLFTASFDVERAAIIPYSVVKDRATYVPHTNAWNVILRPSLWDAGGVQDISDRLRVAAEAAKPS